MRAVLTLFVLAAFATLASAKPNIILIMTDDQGYGDFGAHGNPKIQTPNLDAFAKQSMQLRHFYVCPVCSPTRSSLMTGRSTYRTGIVDTAFGRSMMHPDETTLAEILGANGYRTGLFGKWHLGDNYPLRPQEQGFQEVLAIKGGGLGQPSDLPDGGSYFNPILLHNGKPERQQGYISDIITTAAINFIKAKSAKPFFVYMPFNCPHGPPEVGDDELEPYKKMNLALDQFPKTGAPVIGKYSIETTARIYAMVTNIDRNLGRLFKALDTHKLADDTIVIFLTDNGPQQPRYNSGFRGLKASVYEGGVRVPFYARWPGQFPAGKGSDVVAAHIDVLPTLLAASGVALPKGLKIDGISVLPALKGEMMPTPERTIHIQWHRGEVPDMGRSYMARGPQYKIVQPQGVQPGPAPKDAKIELYDIINDPAEQTNLADKHPEIVEKMRKDYEAWFKDVKADRNFLPPRIIVGSEKENPSLLTRQDWRGPRSGWTPNDQGFWELNVERPGTYRVTLFEDKPGDRSGHVLIGGATGEAKFVDGKAVIDKLNVKQGDTRLEAWLGDVPSSVGPRYVQVERLGD